MDINFLSLSAAFFSAVLAAMGLGGGSLLLLWLLLFTNLPQIDAQALNLFLFLPTAALSALLHYKQKLLQTTALKRALPFGIMGSLLGSALSSFLPTELLKKCFAIFLLLIAGRELLSLWKERKQKLPPQA